MKLLNVEYPFIVEHQPSAICFGYFDGLHRGHFGLIEQVMQDAKKQNLQACLFTFDPNPNFVLGKLAKEEQLTTIEDRFEILQAAGLNEMIVAHFTKTVASLAPEEFIEQYIIALNAKVIVVGFDFHFGYKGQGDYHTLMDLAKGRYEVRVIQEIDEEQLKISTTRISVLIKEGEISKANALLNRPYRIKGVVVKGQGRGRLLEYPTINIKKDALYIQPKRGVYACKVRVDGQIYLGMGNVGYHPTIQPLKEDIIEVHIFDFDQDIYAKTVEVSFYAFIREEVKFASLEELTKQLVKDKETILQYFIN